MTERQFFTLLVTIIWSSGQVSTYQNAIAEARKILAATRTDFAT